MREPALEPRVQSALVPSNRLVAAIGWGWRGWVRGRVVCVWGVVGVTVALVDFAVLGPVLVDGRPPRGAIERALLARLLVAPGAPVSAGGGGLLRPVVAERARPRRCARTG